MFWRSQVLTCPYFCPGNLTVIRGTSGSRPHFTDMMQTPCQDTCSHRRRGSCRQGRAQQFWAAISETVRGSQRLVEKGKEGGLRLLVSLRQFFFLTPSDNLNYLNAACKTTLVIKDRGNEEKQNPVCVNSAYVAIQKLSNKWNISFLFKQSSNSTKSRTS